MRKTKKEIIDETFAHYNEDPSRRGLLTGPHGARCAYIGTNGTRCAVGRCLGDIDPAKVRRFNSDAVCDLVGVFGDDIFKEEYRGHSDAFWYDLQYLHDSHSNWDSQGATPKGVAHAATLHDIWDHQN